MKTKTIAKILLCAGVLISTLASRAFAGSEKENQSELQAKAKISEAQARSIALAKVPNGTIKEGGIETEKGHVVWSFDIATPNTEDITEVQVDANSGEVVSITTEKAKDEAREAKGEHKGKHKKAKSDEDEKAK